MLRVQWTVKNRFTHALVIEKRKDSHETHDAKLAVAGWPFGRRADLRNRSAGSN
jgi:hypothetical protein